MDITTANFCIAMMTLRLPGGFSSEEVPSNLIAALYWPPVLFLPWLVRRLQCPAYC
jgi:hypothetical protein